MKRFIRAYGSGSGSVRHPALDRYYRLPSNKQKLLCLLANFKDLHCKQALSNVIDNVLSHCRKANIPTFTDRTNVGRVIKTYYDKIIKLNKINKENRNAQYAVIISFQTDLEKTMRLYPNKR